MVLASSEGNSAPSKGVCDSFWAEPALTPSLPFPRRRRIPGEWSPCLGSAMIYLHRSNERQRKIAEGIGDMARAELAKTSKVRSQKTASGTDLARRSGRPATGDRGTRTTGA